MKFTKYRCIGTTHRFSTEAQGFRFPDFFAFDLRVPLGSWPPNATGSRAMVAKAAELGLPSLPLDPSEALVFYDQGRDAFQCRNGEWLDWTLALHEEWHRTRPSDESKRIEHDMMEADRRLHPWLNDGGTPEVTQTPAAEAKAAASRSQRLPAQPRIINEGITREEVQKLARFISLIAPMETAIYAPSLSILLEEARAIATKVLAQSTVIEAEKP